VHPDPQHSTALHCTVHCMQYAVCTVQCSVQCVVCSVHLQGALLGMQRADCPSPNGTTALHCTALHCTALHCTGRGDQGNHCLQLGCPTLHSTALFCTALQCHALHTTMQCAPHYSAMRSTLQCNVLHTTVQCAPHYSAMRSTLQCSVLHTTVRFALPQRIAPPGWPLLCSQFLLCPSHAAAEGRPPHTALHCTLHCTALKQRAAPPHD
jgi:hypothetical protein